MEELNEKEKNMLVAMFEMMDKVVSRFSVYDRNLDRIEGNMLFELAEKLGIDGDIHWG